jgi:hypothetical protein
MCTQVPHQLHLDLVREHTSYVLYDPWIEMEYHMTDDRQRLEKRGGGFPRFAVIHASPGVEGR